MAATTTQPKAISPTQFLTKLQKMLAGIQANVPAATSLMINGAAVKQAAIIAALQAWIAQWQAVATAQQSYKTAVTGRLGSTVAANTYYKGLKAVIKTYFGAESPLLESFGITPDKALATSTKTKMVAAAKRTQTRDVRGTKGKKQKAAITVVGTPPLSLASDGTVAIGAPPLTLPDSTTTSSVSTGTNTTPSTPASTAAPTSTPAAAGTGTGGATPAGA